MTEFELLVDFYKDNHRQGPGSQATTLHALEHVRNYVEPQKILDIGCGAGAQTLDLAEATKAEITAVDIFPVFLDLLNEKAKKQKLQKRISTAEASMDNLPFEKESFDLIWSEGAIYLMGFKEGIEYWKQFLKPGGLMAISEISYFTQTRPKEIDAYWKESYPQMNTISAKIADIEAAGFAPVAHFALPENCWVKHYYEPMSKITASFLQRHENSAEAIKLVEEEKNEMELYQKYKAYYGYAFYIFRK